MTISHVWIIGNVAMSACPTDHGRVLTTADRERDPEPVTDHLAIGNGSGPVFQNPLMRYHHPLLTKLVQSRLKCLQGILPPRKRNDDTAWVRWKASVTPSVAFPCPLSLSIPGSLYTHWVPPHANASSAARTKHSATFGITANPS